MKTYRFVTACIFLFIPTGCILFSIAAPFFDCKAAYRLPPEYDNYPYTNYAVHPNARTPGGIEVDTSGFAVNLQELDEEKRELEDCMGLKIPTCSVTVKVAPDWREVNGLQGFPCIAAQQNCPEGKTCLCSEHIQRGSVIIITPNHKGFRHGLAHHGLRTPLHPEKWFGDGKCADIQD